MNKPYKLHIVIAEDDPDDSEIILGSFQKHDSFHTVEIVENGQELLDYLSDDDKPQPDVILTDINMPIMSGIEALEVICEDSRLSQIPTFVYSTSINPIYKLKCMQLGTRAFLIKPFKINEFDAIPKKIVEILNQG